MERRIALVALGLAVLLACVGCVGLGKPMPWSPEAKLATVRATFNAAVNSLASIREAGGFTKDAALEISGLIHTGERLLDRVDAAIELGQSTGELFKQVNFVVRELVAIRVKAERRAGK